MKNTEIKERTQFFMERFALYAEKGHLEAYKSTEEDFIALHGVRRFKNYNVFSVIRCRFYKRERRKQSKSD